MVVKTDASPLISFLFNQACSNGTYGDECSQSCTCNANHTTSCDHISGECLCNPGYSTPNCTTRKRNRKRFDSVLWQNTNTHRKNSKRNVTIQKTPPKTSMTQRLLTDLERLWRKCFSVVFIVYLHVSYAFLINVYIFKCRIWWLREFIHILYNYIFSYAFLINVYIFKCRIWWLREFIHIFYT